MKLTEKAAHLKPVRDDTKTGEKDYTCHKCGVRQQGNWHHCSSCPDCSLSFPQLAGFDRHRVGPLRDKHHMTADELAADGWQQDPEHAHVWRLPVKDESEVPAS